MPRTMGWFFICGAMVFAGGCSAAAVSHLANPQPATMPTATSDDGETAAYKRTAALMSEQVEIQAEKLPLEEVLASIANNGQVPMVVNWEALRASNVERTRPVTVHLKHTARGRILKQALLDAGGIENKLDYTIDDDGVVEVDTYDDLSSTKYQLTCIYNIPAVFGRAELEQDSYFREIADIIKSTVAPDSWRDAGGTIGSIRELNGQLIITQTRDNHRTIASLLRDLRKAALDRVHVYDVRDVVGTDDKRLVRLMNAIESLSSATTWVGHNGYLAVMRGINGRIFVTGPARVQEEVAYLLELIRENDLAGGSFNVLKPTGLPHSTPPPPSTQPWPHTFDLSALTH